LIFRKLCEEEAERRAHAEYMENLRNELSAHDAETRARDAELREIAKKERQKAELQAAAEYDRKLKEARLAEEKVLEEEFKRKMAAKFAEDERIE
jgi:hypothetical protein